MLTLKLSNFRPAYQNQIDFDHPHKNQANQSLHLKQMIVGPRTKNNSILTIRTEPSQSIPTLKTNEFGPDTKTKSNSIPTLKTKSISIHTPTQSNFRPAHKNEVNFDPRTKTMSISTPTLKPCPFYPPHWNQVNFNPNTEVKSISTLTLDKSFLMPSDTKTKLISIQILNQVIFDPHTDPLTKPSQVRSLHWNQVNSDPPRQNQGYFDHPCSNQVSFDTNTKPMSFSSRVILRVIHTGTCSCDTAAIRTT